MTFEEILEIHNEILKNTGGEAGILFIGNLKLCVESPQRNEFGYEPCSTIYQKAASLLYEINKLHPFVDGNKRTAYSATSTFLDLNGFELKAEISEAVNLLLNIAKCSMNFDEVTNWLQNHIKKK
ncbi:MAG: type II toxin-antitoxin system death-on-curing family toxin [Candidatus Bathyarchaeia archaeon]